jgi:hypothetical protein
MKPKRESVRLFIKNGGKGILTGDLRNLLGGCPCPTMPVY